MFWSSGVVHIFGDQYLIVDLISHSHGSRFLGMAIGPLFIWV